MAAAAFRPAPMARITLPTGNNITTTVNAGAIGGHGFSHDQVPSFIKGKVRSGFFG